MQSGAPLNAHRAYKPLASAGTTPAQSQAGSQAGSHAPLLSVEEKAQLAAAEFVRRHYGSAAPSLVQSGETAASVARPPAQKAGSVAGSEFNSQVSAWKPFTASEAASKRIGSDQLYDGSEEDVSVMSAKLADTRQQELLRDMHLQKQRALAAAAYPQATVRIQPTTHPRDAQTEWLAQRGVVASASGPASSGSRSAGSQGLRTGSDTQRRGNMASLAAELRSQRSSATPGRQYARGVVLTGREARGIKQERREEGKVGLTRIFTQASEFLPKVASKLGEQDPRRAIEVLLDITSLDSSAWEELLAESLQSPSSSLDIPLLSVILLSLSVENTANTAGAHSTDFCSLPMLKNTTTPFISSLQSEQKTQLLKGLLIRVLNLSKEAPGTALASPLGFTAEQLMNTLLISFKTGDAPDSQLPLLLALAEIKDKVEQTATTELFVTCLDKLLLEYNTTAHDDLAEAAEIPSCRGQIMDLITRLSSDKKARKTAIKEMRTKDKAEQDERTRQLKAEADSLRIQLSQDSAKRRQQVELAERQRQIRIAQQQRADRLRSDAEKAAAAQAEEKPDSSQTAKKGKSGLLSSLARKVLRKNTTDPSPQVAHPTATTTTTRRQTQVDNTDATASERRALLAPSDRSSTTSAPGQRSHPASTTSSRAEALARAARQREEIKLRLEQEQRQRMLRLRDDGVQRSDLDDPRESAA